MKLDLSLADAENFMCHQHLIGEHQVMLIQPVHIGCNWTKDNMVFRSVVVDVEGNIVSASFKKFVNWGEKPHLTPPPTNLANARLMEKLDGSTLIFSRYKGHTVIRTRGTVDARKQENGYEIDILCEKYPRLLETLESTDTHTESFIFEWTSPSNKIVLNYGDEPDMVLTGIIDHTDYSYMSQAHLDVVAKSLGLRRPKTYSYNSVEEMQQAVTDMKGMEGLCIYFHNDQEILKVKSAQYLYLHRAKSEISSVEKVMDLYLSYRDELGHTPSYQEFFAYLEKMFDYEIATMAISNVSQIADAMKEVENILDGMKRFIESIRVQKIGNYTVTLNDRQVRRGAAERIIQAYGNTGRSAMVFKMLDGKPLVADDYKKLLFQVLK
jgi:hypothetical protein